MKTKEEIINRIDWAITISEMNGYSETLLALERIRAQLLDISGAETLQFQNQSRGALRLS